MQSTKRNKSRCTFCGSVDYGKGCRYGPHGVHFHPDDSTKCAYCGSTDYGKGCRINPTNTLHIHGSVFNNMYKENIQSFLDYNVLLNELKKDYIDFPCYALGIIDENGNKIKNPLTEQEHLSYTSYTKTILKLKRYLGSKTELLEATNNLEKISMVIDENIEHYKKVLFYQEKIDNVVNELHRVINEAQTNGVPPEDLKRLIRA